jgi:outer membrane protein TolC
LARNMKINWIIFAGLLAALSVPARPGLAQETAPQTPRQSSSPISAFVSEQPDRGTNTESPFFGSVVAGQASTGEVALSLSEAIDRGLKNNLGRILAGERTRGALGAEWQARSGLLPNVTTRTSEATQELNLAAFGFADFPGLTNSILGPFAIFDTRIYLKQSVFDWSAISKARAGSENRKSAQESYQDARDVVVTVVASLYLEALAGRSRIEAAEAELKTAQALADQAANFKQAGTVPAIEVLRSEVELRSRRQRLIFYQNEFEKQKLALARAVGIPLAQRFRLTDTVAYSPLTPMSTEEAIERAYRGRRDYQSAVDALHAVEYSKKAAEGERLPSVAINADFGDLGQRIGKSHQTYSTSVNLEIPIFEGGRTHGAILEADAALERQRAQIEGLRGRIEYEVRAALLDLKAASDRVEVAQSAQELAQKQMEEAGDRFAAGVTGNIEVVQAQEALSTAHENYISSTHAFNLAKTALVRAMGGAEQSYKQFLLGDTQK